MVAQEYKRRRRQLMRIMGSRSLAILPAASLSIRNRDVHFPYRQDSDFYYLTGFPEPEAIAVLVTGRPQGEFILFCRSHDEEKERWDGLRAGQNGAVKTYGADESFPIGGLDDILPGILEQTDRVYYAMGCNADLDHRLAGWVNRLRAAARSGVRGPIEFVALDHYLHDMRLYKSQAELKVMRKAASISAQAHRQLMLNCRPGMMEYELEAGFVYECARLGARAQAYSPIVGGGANACVLHYISNDHRLKNGDLVLIDAGCEYQNYAADITRTFPVNGRFSPEQRELYALVLAAQEAAIAQVKPGNHWNQPHEAAVATLTKGLVRLGLLQGTVHKLIQDEAYKPFYMHKTGHWLGMDVHDVGDYKVDGEWRMFEPGMVTTIEPGIYIPPGSKTVDEKWWGIGIRIEDDVVVTKTGNEVLTDEVPKRIQEIEALMAH